MATTVFFSYIVFWIVALMYVAGLFGAMEHKNIMKKLMAMNILQTAVIVFFLLFAFKPGAIAPLWTDSLTSLSNYANPLPQGLMLTAIVVNISTTGISLVLTVLIHRKWGSLEEDEILQEMCATSATDETGETEYILHLENQLAKLENTPTGGLDK